ncbi:hypothetical protein [Ranid herpesvirus 3]|uniref:Uncharacterized protein n=1 Tax=Ranid herpesvirus 3 TaxID=1987509 RepID=A0A1X9T5C2_9VIRU|nr:hypothetical protein [Ranid herpesvirus 3]ARR28899.1 hypothetical protein [Ranid herpesvirus 3]
MGYIFHDQCFDGILTEVYMWFITQRLNPHLAKVKCAAALIAISKPPNRNHGLCEAISLSLTSDKKTPSAHPYLLECDELWTHEGREISKRSPLLLRYLVIKQFHYFLLRYNLVGFCRDVTASTFQRLDEAIKRECDIEPIKMLLPKSYCSSESYRFHNQLFQYTKQYADHTAVTKYNGQIMIAQSIIKSRQMTQPLCLVPLVSPKFKNPFLNLIKLITQQVWCSGQNREEKTVWLIRNLTAHTPEDSVEELFCVMYHILNAYLNWVQFNWGQMIVSPGLCRTMKAVDPDLRCRACFKTITPRCNKSKRKYIGYLYCIDDRRYLSSCCESPMICVPLERECVNLMVYTVTKHKYGLCRCGDLCVVETRECANEIVTCPTCAYNPLESEDRS